MNLRSALILILLIGTLFSSCDEDEIEFEDDYSKSYKTWQAFKKASANSYMYTVTGSSWAGLEWETILTVSDGNVTQREFSFTYIAPGAGENIPEEDLEWVETGSELGSHDYAAADVLTLEQVYKKAKRDWLKGRTKTVTYFETENEGLISLCGYVPKGCVDDCFTGIEIKSIERLP